MLVSSVVFQHARARGSAAQHSATQRTEAPLRSVQCSAAARHTADSLERKGDDVRVSIGSVFHKGHRLSSGNTGVSTDSGKFWPDLGEIIKP